MVGIRDRIRPIEIEAKQLAALRDNADLSTDVMPWARLGYTEKGRTMRFRGTRGKQ